MRAGSVVSFLVLSCISVLFVSATGHSAEGRQKNSCVFENSLTFLKDGIRFVGVGCPEKFDLPASDYPKFHDIRFRTHESSFKGLYIDNLSALTIHTSEKSSEVHCEVLIPISVPKDCTVPLYSVHSTAAAYLSENHKARFKILVKNYDRKNDKPDGFASPQLKGGNHDINVYTTYNKKGGKPSIIVPCKRSEPDFMLSVKLVAKHRNRKKGELESHHSYDSLAVLFSHQEYSDVWQMTPCS